MKVIIVTAMAVAISFPVFSEESQPEILSLEVASKTGMTMVERKNREIMSSFKNYTRVSNQSRMHYSARIHKQYHQFMKNK